MLSPWNACFTQQLGKAWVAVWRQFVDKKFISSSRRLLLSSLRVIISSRPVDLPSRCVVRSSRRFIVSSRRVVLSSRCVDLSSRVISSFGRAISSCRPVISGHLVVLSSHLVVSFFHLVLSCHLLESSCHLVVLSCHLVISFIKSTENWILGFEKREVRELTCFPAFGHRFWQDGRSQCCKGYSERRPVPNWRHTKPFTSFSDSESSEYSPTTNSRVH